MLVVSVCARRRCVPDSQMTTVRARARFLSRCPSEQVRLSLRHFGELEERARVMSLGVLLSGSCGVLGQDVITYLST